MNIPTTVPVTISPEAADKVRELGRERELEQMLEHACRTVPDLLSIDVELVEPYDCGDTPRVVVNVWMREPDRWEDDHTQQELGRWEVRTFPPEVNEHFTLLVQYRRPDGR